LAETRSTYFEVPRYGIDSDETLTRTDWEEFVTRLEERAAYDDGATAATLPVDRLKPGRYARQSFADGYALHRRSASAWEWVGGTIVPVRQRYRGATSGDVMLSTDIAGAAATATLTAGGELGTAGLVRSVAGGSFGADLATDLSVPSATGRLHVRTRATGERAVVARAHAADAGNLLSAVEVGGSVTWSVDAAGRMRSSVPAALGGATPTTNVPLAVAPTADTDTSAVRLVARVSGDVPAIRVLRDLADADDILSVRPDLIRIGRSAPAWTGGLIELRAPNVNVVGAVTVSGGAVTAAEATIEELTAFGGEPIVVVDALSDIVSPVMGMWALLKSNYIIHRYNGAWVPAMPLGSGTTNATRHRARYVKNAPQSIPSSVTAYTAVSFQTVAEACEDVTASGTGNTTFTLNRDGEWDIAVQGSYTGNPGGGRRGLFLLDSITAPTVKYASQVAFPEVDAAADVSCAVVGRWFAAGTVIRPATFHEGSGAVSMVATQEGTAITFAWRRG
jgi:hypothetical protein